MIYTFEKRHEFGGGVMSTYYGLFKYEKRYANGILANGTLVKRFNKKTDCLKYCDKYNLSKMFFTSKSGGVSSSGQWD